MGEKTSWWVICRLRFYQTRKFNRRYRMALDLKQARKWKRGFSESKKEKRAKKESRAVWCRPNNTPVHNRNHKKRRRRRMRCCSCYYAVLWTGRISRQGCGAVTTNVWPSPVSDWWPAKVSCWMNWTGVFRKRRRGQWAGTTHTTVSRVASNNGKKLRKIRLGTSCCSAQKRMASSERRYNQVQPQLRRMKHSKSLENMVKSSTPYTHKWRACGLVKACHYLIEREERETARTERDFNLKQNTNRVKTPQLCCPPFKAMCWWHHILVWNLFSSSSDCRRVELKKKENRKSWP